jgi:hypothetical protein
MTGESGAHTNRPELVVEHGYDTSSPCTHSGSAYKALSS